MRAESGGRGRLAGFIAFASGFVAALGTTKYGVTLVIGALVVLALYVFYVLTVGEGTHSPQASWCPVRWSVSSSWSGWSLA